MTSHRHRPGRLHGPRLSLFAAALLASACGTTPSGLEEAPAASGRIADAADAAAPAAPAAPAALKREVEAARADVAEPVPTVAPTAPPPPPVVELAAPQSMPSPAPAYAASAVQAGAMAQNRSVEGSAKMLARPLYKPVMPPPSADTENYAHVADNPVQRVAERPVSTFSVDVDTGSYSNARRFLEQGRLPPADAVRVEEFVNYFRYAEDAPPKSTSTPFAVRTELAPNPWNAKTKLLRIGIKGYAPQGPLPPSNLVFLVDVSGSMAPDDRLPLVKSSLKLLLGQMGPRDRISLVTYAGGTRVVLEPTPASERATIEAAIDALNAGGGTAGASGIELAYQQARKGFFEGGNNRLLLATDGDFNVGVTRFETLVDMVKEKRKAGIALTTLGFGTGNYNDRLMEQLADAGDGNYAYIDGLKEAQKALVEERASTLLTIARDVKIQVEFNPAAVSEYRLVGYENRALQREDFANDAVDAGDIGAGHHVTALYELALVGEGGERNEPLRYAAEAPTAGKGGELAFVRLRYKRPDQDASRLIEQPVLRSQAKARVGDTSASFRLAAAVAAFGQKLKGGTYLGGFGYRDIAALARDARGGDAGEDASELVRLVGIADGLSAGVVNEQQREGPPVAR